MRWNLIMLDNALQCRCYAHFSLPPNINIFLTFSAIFLSFFYHLVSLASTQIFKKEIYKKINLNLESFQLFTKIVGISIVPKTTREQEKQIQNQQQRKKQQKKHKLFNNLSVSTLVMSLFFFFSFIVYVLIMSLSFIYLLVYFLISLFIFKRIKRNQSLIFE